MPPTRITILDLSAYVGLLAVGAVTLNVLLGLLMAFRYSPHRSWPHHRFNYFRFHNWTGYFVLALSILHRQSAPKQESALPHLRPRLSCPFAVTAPRQHHRRYRAVPHRICRSHFLFAHPSRPP